MPRIRNITADGATFKVKCGVLLDAQLGRRSKKGRQTDLRSKRRDVRMAAIRWPASPKKFENDLSSTGFHRDRRGKHARISQ